MKDKSKPFNIAVAKNDPDLYIILSKKVKKFRRMRFQIKRYTDHSWILSG